MLTCHWKWNYIPTPMNFMNKGIIVKTTLTDFSWKKELLPKNYIKKIHFNFSDTSFRTYIFLYSNGNIVYSYLLSLSLYLLVCFICIEKKWFPYISFSNLPWNTIAFFIRHYWQYLIKYFCGTVDNLKNKTYDADLKKTQKNPVNDILILHLRLQTWYCSHL